MAGAIGGEVRSILDKDADRLLVVKDNWPRLAEDVRPLFADPGTDAPGTDALDTSETTDLDHGRSEIRRHVVRHERDWLTSDRRCPGEPRRPGLKAIAMVEVTVASDRCDSARSVFEPST